MIPYWEGLRWWKELVAETEDAVMVSWRWVGVQEIFVVVQVKVRLRYEH
jgi:hypothetical protein